TSFDTPRCARWLFLEPTPLLGGLFRRSLGLGFLAADDAGELFEELGCHGARCRIDEARAQHGELAPDLGLDVIGKLGAAIGILETNIGAARGKAGKAALAFARYAVARGRVEIAQIDDPDEAGLDRPDLGDDFRFELGSRTLSDRFAAGNALL